METIKTAIERMDLPMRKLSKQLQGGSECTLLTSKNNKTENDNGSRNNNGALVQISNAELVKVDRQFYISQYNDQPPQPEDFAMAVKKLSVAFPQQSVDFFKIAVQEMADMGFTQQRMKDAVTNLIRTFQYKQPNISDIVSYDRKKRIYTYGQMLSKLRCNGGTEESTDSFSKVEIDGKTYWYLPSENI